MGIEIPDCVMNAIPEKTAFDNNYFYHAEETWDRLKNIRDGKVSYISDDYSVLVNTLERYYKGMVQSCHENTNIAKMFTDEAIAELLTSGHKLTRLVDAIEHSYGYKLFACHTREEIKERDRFLNRLTHAYTSARYTESYSYSDFCNTFDFVKQQKERIYALLSPKQKQTYYQQECDFDYEM